MSSEKNSGRFSRLGFQSLRFRLAALYVTIFGLTLIGFSALLYEAFNRNHESEFDTALYNHAVDVASSIEMNLFGQLALEPNMLRRGGKIFPFSVGKSYVQIRSVEGRVIAQSRAEDRFHLPLDRSDRKRLESGRPSFRNVTAGEIPYRMISYVIDRPTSRSFILQIAVPLALLEKEQKAMLAFFLVAIPVVLLLATFGGLHLSRRALAPVGDIIRKANAISAAKLTERLPVPQGEDEIRQLALTLNNLLNRLQEAFDSQERFIADASHQLKTPLAVLRGELDLMRSKQRDPEELQDFLQSASQEIEYLSRMVQDLLILARVAAGKAALEIQEVRADEMALEVISRQERFANSLGVKLVMNLNGADFEVNGDTELLQVMLENLVENAIKFSPPGSNVNVQIRENDREVFLEVRDHGPGVPPDVLPRIFDRFYRSETTKSKAGGVGLGLSIAQRVAQIHQGAIDVQNSLEGGAIFTARLPKELRA